MKKKALQICSLVGLLAVLAVVSAQAQTDGRYKAQIPFDFSIGGKTYQPGSYLISVRNLDRSPTTKIFSVTDAKNRVLR